LYIYIHIYKVPPESEVKKTTKKSDKKVKNDKDDTYTNNRNIKCVDHKIDNEDDKYDAFNENLIIISPVKAANLRNRRMTIEDSAVAVLQVYI
jgi:hypothetical protein